MNPSPDIERRTFDYKLLESKILEDTAEKIAKEEQSDWWKKRANTVTVFRKQIEKSGSLKQCLQEEIIRN